MERGGIGEAATGGVPPLLVAWSDSEPLAACESIVGSDAVPIGLVELRFAISIGPVPGSVGSAGSEPDAVPLSVAHAGRGVATDACVVGDSGASCADAATTSVPSSGDGSTARSGFSSAEPMASAL